MNWKHILPRNAAGHDTTWPHDGKSDCPCKPAVDETNKTVKHKPRHQ